MLIVKKVLWCFAALVLAGCLLWFFCPKPSLDSWQSWSSAWYDSEGELLRLGLAQDERYRLYRKLEDISPRLIDATILYEDQHYYEHFGVDFPAILRAFWQTYIKRERRIGASTIAMQVARLRWNIDSTSIAGKSVQILRAIQLARHYDKDTILEAYFNLAPYGRNIEGVGAASLIYFNKPASRLSLPEALTLSVIPQNPNQRNPATEEGYRAVAQARSSLFQRWLQHYPQDADKSEWIQMPLNVRKLEQLPFHAPHFVNELIHSQRSWQSGEYHTTLNLQRQKSLQAVVNNYIEARRPLGIKNAAMLLINHQTMHIEAMVGSADFFNDDIQGQVNGTTAKRSPGSTLKPFVYGLAFDEGLIHPMSLMRDSQRRFAGFTPENFDKQFLGPLLAKDALALSRNMPAVELQASLRERNLYQFLRQAGVSQLREPSHYGLALTLGGAELSMMELTKLYALLANGGMLHEPKMLLEPTSKEHPQAMLSAEASFMVLDILRNIDKPEAVARSEWLQQNDIAWKTGTSWAFRDAWSIGISGPWVLAVWVGNFNGEGNHAFVGRKAAGPLLFQGMQAVAGTQRWRLEDSFDLDKLNIKKVSMCRSTGDLPGRYCPRRIKNWFIPGVSPIKVSRVYRKIPINVQTGLRSCDIDNDETEMRVYEFWPSDFMTIFQEAGISLKRPPPYDKNCELQQRQDQGIAPVINSPQSSVEYLIPLRDQRRGITTDIPFDAVADADAQMLYWFVGNEFVGSVKNGEKYYWQARRGQHTIKVVDDNGRSSSMEISVEVLAGGAEG